MAVSKASQKKQIPTFQYIPNRIYFTNQRISKKYKMYKSIWENFSWSYHDLLESLDSDAQYIFRLGNPNTLDRLLGHHWIHHCLGGTSVKFYLCDVVFFFGGRYLGAFKSAGRWKLWKLVFISTLQGQKPEKWTKKHVRNLKIAVHFP